MRETRQVVIKRETHPSSKTTKTTTYPISNQAQKRNKQQSKATIKDDVLLIHVSSPIENLDQRPATNKSQELRKSMEKEQHPAPTLTPQQKIKLLWNRPIEQIEKDGTIAMIWPWWLIALYKLFKKKIQINVTTDGITTVGEVNVDVSFTVLGLTIHFSVVCTIDGNNQITITSATETPGQAQVAGYNNIKNFAIKLVPKLTTGSYIQGSDLLAAQITATVRNDITA
jgi:hypothetical protein